MKYIVILTLLIPFSTFSSCPPSDSDNNTTTSSSNDDFWFPSEAKSTRSWNGYIPLSEAARRLTDQISNKETNNGIKEESKSVKKENL